MFSDLSLVATFVPNVVSADTVYFPYQNFAQPLPVGTKENRYPVELARAKLPANAVNVTSGPLVKMSYTQFTWVTCNLPLKTGEIPYVYAARTSRTKHAICLQPHVNLPENRKYFTGNFTCGSHANLPVNGMQKDLLLQAKLHAFCRQKHYQSHVNNTRKRRQKYCQHTAGKLNCKLQIN